MLLLTRSPFRCLLLASSFLSLGAFKALAQSGLVAPHGYDFLTVLTVESSFKTTAKLVITPAFQNTSTIPLAEALPQSSTDKNVAAIVQNTLTINQKLSELTTAGWELFQVYTMPPASGDGFNPVATRYLFRKPKP